MKLTFNECVKLVAIVPKLTCRSIIGENLVKVLTLKRECAEKTAIHDDAIKAIANEYKLEQSENGFVISGEKKDEILSKLKELAIQETEIKTDPFLTIDELISISQNLIISELEICEKLIVKTDLKKV